MSQVWATSRDVMIKPLVQRNSNGLTYSEWLYAAGKTYYSEYWIAWNEGKDPAEYR